MFRGREVFHPELGKRILDRVAAEVDGAARVEAEPRLDGRNMIMVLAPDKRARQSAAAREARPDEAGQAAAPATVVAAVPVAVAEEAAAPAPVAVAVAEQAEEAAPEGNGSQPGPAGAGDGGS